MDIISWNCSLWHSTVSCTFLKKQQKGKREVFKAAVSKSTEQVAGRTHGSLLPQWMSCHSWSHASPKQSPKADSVYKSYGKVCSSKNVVFLCTDLLLACQLGLLFIWVVEKSQLP